MQLVKIIKEDFYRKMIPILSFLKALLIPFNKRDYCKIYYIYHRLSKI